MQPWVTEIDRYVESPNVQLLLVGNKTDLSDRRVVSKAAAEVCTTCKISATIAIVITPIHTSIISHCTSLEYPPTYDGNGQLEVHVA